MSVTVLNRQNLLDIALQEYGSATAIFDIALSNDIGITDTIEVGRGLMIVPSNYEDIDILNFYQQKQIKPATALTTDLSITEQLTGIGLMVIEGTDNPFTVT